MKQTQWHSSKGNSCRQMTLTKQKFLLEILYTLYVATKTSRIPRKVKRFFRWGIFCFEYPRRRSGKGNVYFANYRFSFRKLQIFISQTTDFHFAIDFLLDNIYVRFGSSVFRQVIGIPMGTNSAPLLADLFLHTFECDFMVKTMKHDITKASQFSNTFRYIDDLLSINNVDFGNYISAIYPPELQLTDTSTSSTEVCYLDTHIKTGDTTIPFRISIYDKRDDFTFRIVNFPHMDSNIPANPAYGVYISQLVRYARICTSKVDFMNRLRGLSLRLRQQGFLTNLLQRTFTKFFHRHGLIVVKYGATLREMRFALQA